MSVFRLWCNGYWTRIIYWPKRWLKSLSVHWLHWWHLSQHELSHVKSIYCSFKLWGIQHTISQRKVDHDFLYIISLLEIMTAVYSVARMLNLCWSIKTWQTLAQTLFRERFPCAQGCPMNRGSTVFFFKKVVLIMLFVFPARPRTNLLRSCELQRETVQKGLWNVTLG